MVFKFRLLPVVKLDGEPRGRGCDSHLSATGLEARSMADGPSNTMKFSLLYKISEPWYYFSESIFDWSSARQTSLLGSRPWYRCPDHPSRTLAWTHERPFHGRKPELCTRLCSSYHLSLPVAFLLDILPIPTRPRLLSMVSFTERFSVVFSLITLRV